MSNRKPSLALTTSTTVNMFLVAYLCEGQIVDTVAGETLEEACEAIVETMKKLHVLRTDGEPQFNEPGFIEQVQQLDAATVVEGLRKDRDWLLPFCMEYSVHLLKVRVVGSKE